MNTIKKNSKKGFTLVELVVVIAILAILAAIAIPVVSSTIESSQRSSALSNAQSLELALKEAHAMLAANDNSVYQDDATVDAVYDEKSLTVESPITIGGDEYNLILGDDEKVYYAITVDGTTTSVDGSTVVTDSGLNIVDGSDQAIITLFD